MNRLIRIVMPLIILAWISGCKKDAPLPATNVPNGDFENWTGLNYLQGWDSNSCPPCVPPYDTYIVKKSTDAYHGQYAAELTYNTVYPAYASNKFAVKENFRQLTGYVKCTLYGKDTVSVWFKRFSGTTTVDSGKWSSTSSIKNYQQFTISLSPAPVAIDSVQVVLRGGNKMDASHNGSDFWVDYLLLR
ncbi:MAG TPA: hypothetical protein VHC47_05085 [Mucilaginibacter sp.]|nr:hypothetical protein [Mucilaginibacter sp.]